MKNPPELTIEVSVDATKAFDKVSKFKVIKMAIEYRTWKLATKGGYAIMSLQ